MKTILLIGLLACVCVAYATAIPTLLAEPEAAPAPVAVEEVETLQPEESHYRRWGGHRHHGWGGYGGWGHGGGWNGGGYGGRGHGGYYGGGYPWGR